MRGIAKGGPSEQYWTSYSNLQRVKHDVIREYLNGWFPILGSWAGRVLYIDTHAGRGRHATGELGSPLVALRTFVDHKYRQRVLSASEVRFIFIEKNASNLRALNAELAEYEPLPAGVAVESHPGDSQKVIGDALTYLKAKGQRMAPSFAFVDPYGFSISYGLLRDLMAFGSVELLVNVMWRYLDMAIAQARTVDGKADLLDFVFDTSSWRDAINAPDFDQRAEQALSLIKSVVGARWATPVWMQGANRETEYVLLHLTNHEAGRDLMKRTMWRVCPSSDGRFIARKGDDPAQGVLLTLAPDLGPLREHITGVVRRAPTRWQGLYSIVRDMSWLDSQVNEVVRELLRSGQLLADDYEGRLSAKANPLLRLGAPRRGNPRSKEGPSNEDIH
jgi:three-Cys-motif partner protein